MDKKGKGVIAIKILEYQNMNENDCVTAGAETQVQLSFAPHFFLIPMLRNPARSQTPAWECLQEYAPYATELLNILNSSCSLTP